MRDLSLYLLDLAQLSVDLLATEIRLDVVDDLDKNELSFTFSDNGRGIDEISLDRYIDSYFVRLSSVKTSHALYNLKELAERCQGKFEVSTSVGAGLKVLVTLNKDFMSSLPMARIADTLVSIMVVSDHVALFHTHIKRGTKQGEESFSVNSEEIYERFGKENYEAILWTKEFVRTRLSQMYEED